MASLSVSIVTHNTDQEKLNRALSHLAEAAAHSQALERVDVVVVDNASRQRPAIPGGKGKITCRLAANPRNVGFGAAHNQAMLPSDADYHLVLNPDAYLGESYLSEGIGYLGRNGRLGLVTPWGTTPEGKPLHLNKRFPSVAVLATRALGAFIPALGRAPLNRQYQYEDLSPDAPAPVLLASGCAMLGRTEAFRSVNGFDPRYFLYFEDYDLSLRLQKEWDIHFNPALTLLHEGGSASRKGPRHWMHFLASMARFYNAWGWKIF